MNNDILSKIWYFYFIETDVRISLDLIIKMR